ncbi:MAG: glycosyltransferase family 4 protein [Anaerolineales bacterium]|nr:glycosyltransferase family 4 protein [Anaerolineales bacterium]
MKILAVSNFYPPFELGGESLTCQAILEGLRAKGHHVTVLTSNHGANNSTDHIHRKLRLEMSFQPLWNAFAFFTNWHRDIKYNCELVKRYINELRPDVVFLGSMWNLHREVPATVEKLMGDKVIYRFGNYWPTLPRQYSYYWNASPRSLLTRLPKQLLNPFAQQILAQYPPPTLSFPNNVCISQAVYDEFRKANFHLHNYRTIHNGIEAKQFLPQQSIWLKKQIPNALRLLFVGRLSHEKGVHTAIETLAQVREHNIEAALTIVGTGNKTYVNHLKQLAHTLNMSSHVQFIGKIPITDVPDLMAKHDVLLVPSIWPEPFGRVVLEGMAAGMVVIGSGTGGMQTALIDNRTGLIAPPEQSEAWASQIQRLLTEKNLGNCLALQGLQLIREQFTTQIMVDAYERYFCETIVSHVTG